MTINFTIHWKFQVEICWTCLPTWDTISLEQSLPGMSKWGVCAIPVLRDRTKSSSHRHEAMPCRRGVCSICATGTHAAIAHHQSFLPSEQWGAADVATTEQERNRGTRSNCPPTLQFIALFISWNIYRKMQTRVFIQFFFRVQGMQRKLFF